MATDMLYLDDTYLFEGVASIASVTPLEDGTADFELDRTIFYPQGGGQPCDHGTIRTDTGRAAIVKVSLDAEGIIHHIGTVEGEITAGQSADLAIDPERRTLNARNHSAGHLIDVAVMESGLPGLRATKWYHFADGSYVEYEGEIADPESAVKTLNNILAQLVAEDLALEKRTLTPEEAVHQGVWAPPGKSARTVNFAGHAACGCGGTHVRSTSEIGGIEIRKIHFKKGVTRVSYALI